jgi:hypothetical protein
MADLARQEAAGAGGRPLTVGVLLGRVVAIAITVLALHCRYPHGATNAELRSRHAYADDYIAFTVSFVVISLHWRGHRDLVPDRSSTRSFGELSVADDDRHHRSPRFSGIWAAEVRCSTPWQGSRFCSRYG